MSKSPPHWVLFSYSFKAAALFMLSLVSFALKALWRLRRWAVGRQQVLCCHWAAWLTDHFGIKNLQLPLRTLHSFQSGSWQVKWHFLWEPVVKLRQLKNLALSSFASDFSKVQITDEKVTGQRGLFWHLLTKPHWEMAGSSMFDYSKILSHSAAKIKVKFARTDLCQRGWWKGASTFSTKL